MKIQVCSPQKIGETGVKIAKLDNGLDESPTVMVGEDNTKTKNSVKIGAY